MKKHLLILAAATMISTTAMAPAAHANFFDDIGKAFNAIGTVLLGPVKPLLDKVHGAVKHGVEALHDGMKKLAGPALAAGKKFMDGFVKKMSEGATALAKKGAAFGKGLFTGIERSVNKALDHARDLARGVMSKATGGKVKTLGGLTDFVRVGFAKAFGQARKIVHGKAKHVAGTFRGMFAKTRSGLNGILIGLNRVKIGTVKLRAPVGKEFVIQN